MYTVNGQQIKNMIKSDKEQTGLKMNPLRKLRITGSNGQQILSPAQQSQGKDSFSITETLYDILNPTCGMSEDDRKAYEAKIMQKLKQGKKLTGEEMSYLQMTNPTLYMQAARIQAMRESLENQLENCKSKEEAQDIYSSYASHISKEDPMKGELTAAFGDAMEEFKKTDTYDSLPQKKEQDV